MDFGVGPGVDGPWWLGLAVMVTVAAGIPLVAALCRWPGRRARRRRLSRRLRGLCCRCGYDLRGNESGVCPECGACAGPEAPDLPWG